MYVKHDHVETPSDRTVVWRYMSLAAFAALVLDRALFFSRLDRAEDPWDGLFPKASRDANAVAAFFARGRKLEPEMDDFFRKLAYKPDEDAPFTGRRAYCVSCWHINRNESDAMWKIYSLLGQGIAIQSTVGRLKRAFAGTEEKVYIGRVGYHDYDQILINPAQVFPVVFSKRRSFQHERELRCVLYSWGSAFESEYGHHVSVDIAVLVREVVLSPRAEPWLLNVLQKLVSQAGFAFQCRASTHLLTPAFPTASDPNSVDPPSDPTSK